MSILNLYNNIFPSTEEFLLKASEIIKNGGLVAFPTETVYGLGANGFNPIAVAKIFSVKNRPSFNPLILHIDSVSSLELLTTIHSEKVLKLVDKFWPGPITLVLPKTVLVPEIVTAGNSTVAIRIPNNEIATKLIKLSGVPIAAPSANSFGMLSPTTAVHVANQLQNKIDFILDGGKCSVGLESTIVEFTNDNFFLLRDGGISSEEIEEFLCEKLKRKVLENNPNSPGQLKSHYAPIKAIFFIDEVDISNFNKEKTAIICFSDDKKYSEFTFRKILSTKADFTEAAANLFFFLHELESENVDFILAEKIPEIGLGKAIMDRLTKAVNHYR